MFVPSGWSLMYFMNRKGPIIDQWGTPCWNSFIYSILNFPFIQVTTTGHDTTCCKKPQSCAPEVGHKFVQNMLSYSLEINKTIIVASRWFLYYLESSSFLHTVHIVPRCRTPNPCLPQQQNTIPHVVKKPQSCPPEDGQKFLQNMLKHVELIIGDQ